MYRTPTQLDPATWPGVDPRPVSCRRWVPVAGPSIATAPAMALPAVVKRNGVGNAGRTNSFVHTHATTRRGAPPP